MVVFQDEYRNTFGLHVGIPQRPHPEVRRSWRTVFKQHRNVDQIFIEWCGIYLFTAPPTYQNHVQKRRHRYRHLLYDWNSVLPLDEVWNGIVLQVPSPSPSVLCWLSWKTIRIRCFSWVSASGKRSNISAGNVLNLRICLAVLDRCYYWSCIWSCYHDPMRSFTSKSPGSLLCLASP